MSIHYFSTGCHKLNCTWKVLLLSADTNTMFQVSSVWLCVSCLESVMARSGFGHDAHTECYMRHNSQHNTSGHAFLHRKTCLFFITVIVICENISLDFPQTVIFCPNWGQYKLLFWWFGKETYVLSCKKLHEKIKSTEIYSRSARMMGKESCQKCWYMLVPVFDVIYVDES